MQEIELPKNIRELGENNVRVSNNTVLNIVEQINQKQIKIEGTNSFSEGMKAGLEVAINILQNNLIW